MSRFLEYLAAFLALLVLQEFVFDHISLFGIANPYIYIMFIIFLPLDTPGWALLLLGFVLGRAVDAVSGAAGLQTVVATWLAFVRPTAAGFLLGKDMVYEGGIPTAPRVGPGKFFRYVTAMVLLFDIPFFILEDLSGKIWIIAARILIGSLFSVVIIYFLHLPFVHARIKN